MKQLTIKTITIVENRGTDSVEVTFEEKWDEPVYPFKTNENVTMQFKTAHLKGEQVVKQWFPEATIEVIKIP